MSRGKPDTSRGKLDLRIRCFAEEPEYHSNKYKFSRIFLLIFLLGGTNPGFLNKGTNPKLLFRGTNPKWNETTARFSSN